MAHKDQSFYTTIKEKAQLNPGSEVKSTFHLSLALPENAPTYMVGDCLGIHPENPTNLVSKTLKAMHADANKEVTHRRFGTMPFVELLKTYVNLSQVTKPILKALLAKESDSDKQAKLAELLDTDKRELFLNYTKARELWDILEEHPQVRLSEEEWTKILPPLMPRLYSIASSPTLYPNEVHLLIKYVRYESLGHTRDGVCSHYLFETTPSQLNCYLQHSKDFKPPEEKSPIIMIGPGTGVAPFRGFIQERCQQGIGNNWLFFGEQHADSDFFYKEEWLPYIDANLLRVTTAFSRDQKEKIYVQNRILEHKDELWNWIQSGAYIYLCGDAEHMAPSVEKALTEVISSGANISISEAEAFIEDLRSQKRFVKDVY